VPRKYHRPPDTTTKRRKSRKTPIPYEFEAPSESAGDVDEGTFRGEEARLPASAEVVRDTARSGISGKGERHVTVDYSYVRGEVARIAAIIGFLVISLIITSIFR
jgi:hypothetical protein